MRRLETGGKSFCIPECKSLYVDSAGVYIAWFSPVHWMTLLQHCSSRNWVCKYNDMYADMTYYIKKNNYVNLETAN